MWYLGDWTLHLKLLFPNKEAIFDVTTQQRITYAALEERVAYTAAVFRSWGVKKGDRVAILSKNRLEHIDALFACARLGAMLVPLNWRLTESELAFMVDDSKPTALLFDATFAATARNLCQRAALPVLRCCLDPQAVIEGDTSWKTLLTQAQTSYADQPVSQENVSLDDPWIILYTSGTTGTPKGALLPHRQVFFNATNTGIALDLRQDDSTITYTPMFHTGALHVLTTPVLLKGGKIILMEAFDAEQIIQLHEKERCTILFGVPTTFEMLASHPRFNNADLKSVRIALCGGAPCPISLIERYTQRGITFKQGYGLTEVGPNCLNLNPEDVVRKAGSAGRPNLTIQVRVLDDDGNTIKGAGRGELAMGGPCVCLGYWNRPDANKSSFTDDGFFKTGDVVEVDADGYFYIVDRKKDMFISGGENVYPAEVEKVLCDHPNIRAAAVIGIPDVKWGEVGRAYLEVRQGILDKEEITAFARERLARYKVPKEFAVVEALPRNPSGKIQKHLLPKDPLVEG